MTNQAPASQSNDEDRTTSTGLARYAYEYIQAARLVDKELGKHHIHDFVSPIPAYFLALHGIELTLKAYLRHHGFTLNELSSKKYGHNIHKCYRKAKELGLLSLFKESERDLSAIELLMSINQNMGLRYIQTGYKTYPSWSIIEPLAVRLHQAISPLLGYKTFDVHFGEY